MLRGMLKVVGVAVLLAVVLAPNGCALLNTGTQTSDGDAQMQLGEYKGLKHAIGCIDFKNEAGWRGRWELGNNLSIMLESALMDTGRFVLVERDKLNAVIKEQDLAASGRTAKAKNVAKTGLLRPAKYLATGAVTTVEEGASGGSGGITIGPISLGGGGSKAAVTIIAKLVDTTTGEIKAKKRIIGRAGRKAMSVGLHTGIVNTRVGGFKKTPLGDAAQDCINRAAIFFAKTMETFAFEGSVAAMSGNRVVINRGSKHGIAPGKLFVMREEGEIITDAGTGEVLGKNEGKQIGELKVLSAKEKMSFCEVVSGEKKPKPGTVILEK
ncbi:CsgG/HfaB family protein [Verrucomicrobiota bacterium]